MNPPGTLLALLLLVTLLPAADKPNFVVILSDDQAWTDYGFMGHGEIKTPHLDSLAQRSLVFERGYVASPLCRPSLASMLTGRFPSEHGVTGNDVDARNNRALLDTPARTAFHKLPSFVKLLTANGYLAHQSGKSGEVFARHTQIINLTPNLFSNGTPYGKAPAGLWQILRIGHTATVKLNGQDLGITKRTPFRVALGKSAKTGVNTLEVTAINSWCNCVMADEKLSENKRITKTNIRVQKQGSFKWKPEPSGLVGPVRIVRSTDATNGN